MLSVNDRGVTGNDATADLDDVEFEEVADRGILIPATVNLSESCSSVSSSLGLKTIGSKAISSSSPSSDDSGADEILISGSAARKRFPRCLLRFLA